MPFSVKWMILSLRLESGQQMPGMSQEIDIGKFELGPPTIYNQQPSADNKIEALFNSRRASTSEVSYVQGQGNNLPGKSVPFSFNKSVVGSALHGGESN